jgi:hypothetical protein
MRIATRGRPAFRGVFSAGSISSFGGRIGLDIIVKDAEPVSKAAK